MTKQPGQTAYEAHCQSLVKEDVVALRDWSALSARQMRAWAAAEAASAAKAVEPFELLARWQGKSGSGREVHWSSMRTLGDFGCSAIDRDWPRQTLTEYASGPARKYGEGATATEAATALCIQLGLLPPESGR